MIRMSLLRIIDYFPPTRHPDFSDKEVKCITEMRDARRRKEKRQGDAAEGEERRGGADEVSSVGTKQEKQQEVKNRPQAAAGDPSASRSWVDTARFGPTGLATYAVVIAFATAVTFAVLRRP